MRAVLEATLTMEPPCSNRLGRVARHTRKGPVRFTAKMACPPVEGHVLGSVEATDSGHIAHHPRGPELFGQRRPRWSSTDDSEVTSHRKAMAVPPAAVIVATVVSRLSSATSRAATAAPSAASRTATARPEARAGPGDHGDPVGEPMAGERGHGGVGGVVLAAALAQGDPLDGAHGCLLVGVDPALGSRCELLAQVVLQDLAGRVPGHHVDHLELLGDGLGPQALVLAGRPPSRRRAGTALRRAPPRRRPARRSSGRAGRSRPRRPRPGGCRAGPPPPWPRCSPRAG